MSSFVVFSSGQQRFALPMAEVVEVTRAVHVQMFPHNTPGLEGVVVHRGAVLPVWDLERTLFGAAVASRKYSLVTRHNFAREELTAIPVSSEGQMLRSEMLPPPEEAPAYVSGILLLEGRQVEVLDLEQFRTPGAPAASRVDNPGTEKGSG